MKALERWAIRSLAILAAAIAGCETVGEVLKPVAEIGRAVAGDMGGNTKEEADSKGGTDLTPEQEYYIGRSVAATILESYKPLDDPDLNRYLNLLGQALAQASDKPETFGGYHFLALDSDDINALAAPGGLILVTRGMILCCKDEDMLASVLAHEVGHVQFEHGLRAVKGSRWTTAFRIMGTEAFGGQELAELSGVFEGTVGDITQTMVTSGYPRGFERQADQNAVVILRRVGYDPHALAAMLGEMKKRLKPGGLDFAKTHPDPEDRLIDVRKMLQGIPEQPIPKARQDRFEAFTAKLRGRA